MYGTMITSADIIQRIRAMSEAERRTVHLATGVPEPTLAKIKYGVTNDPRSSTMDALREYFASLPTPEPAERVA